MKVKGVRVKVGDILKDKKILITVLLICTMVTGIMACVKTGASMVNREPRIHFVTINDNSNAIIVECNGYYGVIDSGEDSDEPDGKDSRYPKRSGITHGGYEDQFIEYMESIGVNDKNLDFYIGTHAHSDHIGSADEVIYKFKPKRVYIGEYEDSMINSSDKLWDNQYVYDKMIRAAKDVGAILIQSFDEEGEKSRSFTLGDSMRITIMNTEAPRGNIDDANDASWGVLVEANGKRAFCGGDINYTSGSEDRMLKQLGSVDLLVLGHHGFSGSSSEEYVKGLNPSNIVICGQGKVIGWNNENLLHEMGKNGSKIFAVAQYSDLVPGLCFSFDENMKNNIGEKYTIITTYYGSEYSKSFLLKGGRLCEDYKGFVYSVSNDYWRYFDNDSWAVRNKWVLDNGVYYYINDKEDYITGWKYSSGKWYYLNSNGSMASNKWIKSGGCWYYLTESGAMATGWKKVNDKWYYLASSGEMLTGWRFVSGKWYYLNENGAMATGWKKVKGKYYLLSNNGDMLVGWQKVNDKWYYLESDGSLATDCWIGQYYVDGNGEWTKTSTAE